MEKIPKAPHLLLIRSPFVLLGESSPRWLRLQAFSQSAAPNLQVCDAAMDYMEKCMRYKVHPKAYDASGDIDPLSLLDQLRDFDTVLSLASNRYPPSLFHRHGYAHAGLNGEADLEQFAKDARGNPFREYAYTTWQPFNISTPPALAMLYAESPGQLAPAVTLATAWQSRWPHVPLQLVGPVSVSQGLREKFFFSSGQLAPGMKIAQLEITKIAAESISAASHPNDEPANGSGHFNGREPRPLIADQMPTIVQAALKKQCNFIMWQWRGGKIDATTKQLYAASRQGIWNHLLLDRKSPASLRDFAAANANIVHSYAHREDPLSVFSDPVIRFPSNSPAYGRTKPMPGRPLWMALEKSAAIRTLLSRYEPKRLMRLRVRGDDGSLFEVGKRLAYEFKRPGDLPNEHLDEVIHMVEAGGSVNTQFVRHNLERAYLIAYVEEEGVIVGNSSLKHPREEYIDAVSDQSGIDLHNFLERGYTSVRPEYRGLGVGVKLLEGLTQRAGEYKIFSVIAESNIATQKMAVRNRTRRVATFYSQRAHKEMSVWIPEWMLPKGITLPEQPDLETKDGFGKDPS